MRFPPTSSILLASLLLSRTALAGAEPAITRPVMVAYCQPAETAPTIDGKLDDPCWSKCQPLTNYASDRVERLATQQTTARICYDERFVYFAFDCRDDDMAHSKAVTTGFSLPWFEDSVEVFIDPNYTQKKYEQFGANFLGASNIRPPGDAPNMIMAKGTREEKGYIVELRIPLAAVAASFPLEGKTWGLNLTRNRYRPTAEERSSWGRISGSFHKPYEFGQLIFAPQPDVAVQSVQVNWKNAGLNVVDLAVRNASSTEVPVQVTLGETSTSAVLSPGAESSLRQLTKVQAGANRLPITVRSGERVLYKQELPLIGGASDSAIAEVPDLGCFRITTDQQVALQGQSLLAQAQALIIHGAAVPRLKLSVDLPGEAVRAGAGEQQMRIAIPDGPDRPLTFSLEVVDQQGATLAKTSKVIQIRGQAKAAYNKQISALESRLAKLQFPANSLQAREIQYSKLKLTRLQQLTSSMGDADLPHLEVQIPELTYTLTMLEQNKLPSWGLRNKTYISGVDGSEQGYVLTIPQSYTTNESANYPVLIFLHGFINDAPWSPEGKLNPMQLACLNKGVISISPYGRGSTGYRNCGEFDVWHVLEQVQRDYRIDRDRIYLGGFSMGGGGTLHLANARPHLFAALAPCSCWPAPEQLPALRHLPTWFFCGGQEDCVGPITAARDALQAQGTEAHFTSDPASGHTTDFIDFEKLVDWLLQHRKVQSPREIRYTSREPQHRGAYWAQFDAPIEYGKPSRFAVQAKDQRLEIESENITALTFSAPPAVLDLSRPIEVVLNGEQYPLPAPRDPLRIECIKPATQPNGPAKGANTPSGPISHLFTQSFVIVYGTSADARANQAEAEELVRHWENWYHGRASAIPDTGLTPELIKAHHVVVLGMPLKDSLAQRCLAKLPIALSPSEIRVGDQTIPGTDLGICALGINPESPGKYVLLVAGQTSDSLKLFRNYIPKLPHDVMVATKGPQGEGKPKAAGWFAADWETISLRVLP